MLSINQMTPPLFFLIKLETPFPRHSFLIMITRRDVDSADLTTETTRMDSRVKRQAAFLKSVLREADDHKRKEKFRMANGDQINAVSELALNVMKGVVPVSNQAKIRLRPYANTLRQLSRRRAGIKARRQLLMKQKGGAVFRELSNCVRYCV